MRSVSSFRSRFGYAQLALLAAVALLMVSCSSDDTSGSGGGTGTGPTHTADQLNTMGWESFDIADYTQARIYFDEATTLDPNHNEARLGLAWTEAYTGDHQNAIANFQTVIDNDSSAPDHCRSPFLGEPLPAGAR
jgi:Tfp pilus assembly protein PilF